MPIEDLRPKEHLRVMDLVSEAGIDVSDWANFKGGAEKAASNPKYCYEWCFEDPDNRLIVLNLWYENLEYDEGRIAQKLNARDTAEQVPNNAQKKRAIRMDFAFQKAARLSWPLRVIVCDGVQREETPNMSKSVAESRLLDPEPWHVESYDPATGDCLLVRGEPPAIFVDQFDEEPGDPPKTRLANTVTYQRDPKVRAAVLARSKGNCELCGKRGFETSNGSIYLETHHIRPLSEGGIDHPSNVIALCPNHHREAHFGSARTSLRDRLLKIVGTPAP